MVVKKSLWGHEVEESDTDSDIGSTLIHDNYTTNDDEIEEVDYDELMREEDEGLEDDRVMETLIEYILNCDTIRFRILLDIAIKRLGDKFDINDTACIDPEDYIYDTLLEFLLIGLRKSFHRDRLPFIRILIEYGISVDEVDVNYHHDPKRSYFGDFITSSKANISTIKYLIEALDMNINLDIIGSVHDDFQDDLLVVPAYPHDAPSEPTYAEQDYLNHDRYCRIYGNDRRIIPYQHQPTYGWSSPRLIRHAHGILQFHQQLTQYYQDSEQFHKLSYLLNHTGMYDYDHFNVMIQPSNSIEFNRFLLTRNPIGLTIPAWDIVYRLLDIDIKNPYRVKPTYLNGGGPNADNMNLVDNCCLLFNNDELAIKPLKQFTKNQCKLIIKKICTEISMKDKASFMPFSMVQYLFNEVGLLPISPYVMMDNDDSDNSHDDFDGLDLMKRVADKYIFSTSWFPFLESRIKYFFEEFHCPLDVILLDKLCRRIPVWVDGHDMEILETLKLLHKHFNDHDQFVEVLLKANRENPGLEAFVTDIALWNDKISSPDISHDKKRKLDAI